MNTYKTKNCLTCRREFKPSGGKNSWCSLLCRVLDCCAVSANVNECWPWMRSFDRRGYSEIRLVPVTRFAHRIMYEEFTGEKLTRSEVVRHSCDNPPCCNPFHLEAGSQADNVRDMIARNRIQDYSHQPKGEDHHMAKITAQTALAIFNSGARLNDIAREFGTSRHIVERIKYGKTWNHVTGLPRRKREKTSAA